MVNFTIGAGGDFLTVEAAYSFLVGLGAMGDDYTFDLISSLTINAWPGGQVDCNGHTLLFTCSYNEANPNTPLSWYRIMLNGAAGEVEIYQTAGSDITHVINMEWWYFEHTSNNALNMLMIATWVNNETMTWSVENCWFEGFGAGNDNGIRSNNTRHYYNINKVAMYNVYRALFLSPGGITPGDNFPDRKHVRNVTIYTANTAGSIGVSLGDLDGNNVYLENVASFQRGIGSVSWVKSAGATPDRFRTTNCSDDDNTIVTSLTPSTTITDCLANLVIANELESIVDTSADFLKLKFGTITADFTREPAGNVETNQKIKFTPSVTVTPGAANLNDSGIPVVGMTTDIRGKTIPSVNGEYPIGAHVQEYIT